MLVATHLFLASRLKISLIEAVKILIKQQLNIQDFCLSTKEDPRRASYVVQDKISGSGLSEVAQLCSAESGTLVSYKDGACADKTFAQPQPLELGHGVVADWHCYWLAL